MGMMSFEGAPHAGETRLGVRTIEWIRAEGVERLLSVFCPFRERSCSHDHCLQCGHFDRNEEGAIVCCREPPLSSDEARTLVENRRIYTGPCSLAARTHLGSLGGAVVFCAFHGAPLARVLARLDPSRSPGVVVVDESRQPMGFLPYAHLASLEAPEESLLGDELPGTPYVELPERAPLSQALDLFIREHRRIVVTVDRSRRVTGVLTDVDVLHWLARVSRNL
jgi:hypothetical protein